MDVDMENKTHARGGLHAWGDAASASATRLLGAIRSPALAGCGMRDAGCGMRDKLARATHLVGASLMHSFAASHVPARAPGSVSGSGGSRGAPPPPPTTTTTAASSSNDDEGWASGSWTLVDAMGEKRPEAAGRGDVSSFRAPGTPPMRGEG